MTTLDGKASTDAWHEGCTINNSGNWSYDIREYDC